MLTREQWEIRVIVLATLLATSLIIGGVLHRTGSQFAILLGSGLAGIVLSIVIQIWQNEKKE